MVFTSFVFLCWFLPLFLGVYYALPRRGKNLWLTCASYAFYGWWRPHYVILMFASTLLNWYCARRMGAADAAGLRSRKVWLIASLILNLGMLAWFKYANLFVDSYNDLRAAMGTEAMAWEKVLLPIGISFFTFQSMSYTIDVYFGRVRPIRSIADLACYVAMFPQLVAGPIVRYHSIAAQLQERHTSLAAVSNGCLLFMFGFAKKVLIADQVAPLADVAFGAEELGLLAAWTGVLAYAIQIYFDFSGYSDMAIGLGLMLGFTFPRNFDSPYRSCSITEFWRRWHISLSSWLRDYLYIPLGGSRRGASRTYFALMMTMLLGGLWHGAAWTFVLWGGYQGLFLVLERLLGKRAIYAGLPRPVQMVLTFVIVMFGWAIFRADGMAELGRVLTGMCGGAGVGERLVLPIYEWRS